MRIIFGVFGCLLLVSTSVSLAGAQSGLDHGVVSHPTHVAVSPRLADLPPARPALGIKEGPPVLEGPPLIQDGLQATSNEGGVSAHFSPPIQVRPNVEFPGIGINGYVPPDPNIAVGKTNLNNNTVGYVVQAVNVQVNVYDKTTGTSVLAVPVNLNTFWVNLGGPCGTNNGGDPIVQYDAAADRWLISQLGGLTAPYYECFAVSTTNDPTGTYYQYAYSFGSYLNDYPKIGVWPPTTNSASAYLATYNLFANGRKFSAAALCAYDRFAMQNGYGIANSPNASDPTPAQICINAPSGGSYLPADVDGTTGPQDPPLFMDLYSTSSLHYYTMNNLTFNSSQGTASASLSSANSITVNSFQTACSGGSCIPQPGTSRKLASLGDRLMYRLAYRVFSDHVSIVVNHSITAGTRVGVRWYELRRSTGTAPASSFSMSQQGTLAPSSDTYYRWMGSAAMNSAGDIAIGYSRSSANTGTGNYPSICYAYRKAGSSSPLGTLDYYDGCYVVGGGSQTGTSRWGDYTSLRIDPDNDTTFWYTNEYYPSTSSYSWQTDISSFTLP